ncbi:nuclease-related domain-containing DEAD/DEAH box helicase [Imhoffiella purpurea]|uniref:NERD domain-containing protein n=1 Tax=Imhoffiella purpurea TaxID=1249627 RepID=W9V260_9GAMM|nr:nuclease-related domain-containing DEAD/DEAH box helicase [Imhoffiella purpurea]EXJ13583.1 hypothetical protein D779_3586 [Imhoffiella purpurea]
MAVMYPTPLPNYVLADPLRSTEVRVHRLLEAQLPDEWHVFYSRPWLGLHPDGGEVEGEADFVAVHPKTGMLVLEVKGGVVSRNGTTGEWTSRDRHGIVHSIKDPVRQAGRSRHRLLEKIRESRLWDQGFLNARHGVVLPDSGRPEHDLGPDMPLRIFAFMDDCKELGKWVEGRLAADPDPRATPPGPRGVEAIRRLLAADFELTPTLRSAYEIAERRIDRLTAEQFQLLEQLACNPRMIIRGGAGTGKTMLAVEKAMRLAAAGQRTLLTCYNQPLGHHLQRLCSGVANLTARSFHQLCRQCAAQAETLPAGSGEGRDYFEQTLPQALLDAVETNRSLRFDAIVADEGQDFPGSWWAVLELCLTDAENDPFYIFLDDNQRVHFRQSDAPAYPAFLLTQNLRNAREIFTAAAPLYSGGVWLGSGPTGGSVSFIEAETAGTATARLRQWIGRMTNRERLAPRDLAILSPDAAMAGMLRNAGVTGGIPSCAAHEARDNAIVIDSVRRFKGLERAAVAVCCVDQLVSSTELMYVALTRAHLGLTLIGPAAVLGELKRTIATGSGSANCCGTGNEHNHQGQDALELP